MHFFKKESSRPSIKHTYFNSEFQYPLKKIQNKLNSYGFIREMSSQMNLMLH